MHWSGASTLVTGASGGIGEAFARELGRRGSNLVLSARSADRLEAVAEEIRASCGVRVEVVPVDLGEDDGPASLYEQACTTAPLDAVINNAGFGIHAPVAETDLARLEALLAVNVRALTSLTRAALPGMLGAGRGAIVNVASTAAFQPLPLMAVYGASKAYVLSFTAAVAEEVRRCGVEVLALCPGPVATRFFSESGTDNESLFGPPGTPAEVVSTALGALGRRPVATVGVRNRALGLVSRRAPLRIAAWGAHRMSRRG